jgi:glutamate dehydrogenase
VLLDPLDEEQRRTVRTQIELTLADVYAAVEDFPAILGLVGRTVAELERMAPDGPHKGEALALLRWLEDKHFVFLGARLYEYPRTKSGRWAHEEPLFQTERSLGVLRDPSRGVLRRDNEPALLTSQLRKLIESDEPLVVAKANAVSRVHRRVFLDYVGVKRYGVDGLPFGEVRFVGLFTAEAYEEPVRNTPLIRQKTANVIARAGKAAGSHDQRRLAGVLETYPRDELFQISEDELLSIALGVVHLYDRPRLRLFARKDPFDRFVSVLLFVPRDRFDAALAERAGEILADAWGGTVNSHYPTFSESPLARTHYIIGLRPSAHREPDLALVEQAIAEAALTWRDRLERALHGLPDRAAAVRTRAAFAAAFPPGYRDLFDAPEALADIAAIEALTDDHPVQVRAYQAAGDPSDGFRFKLYRPDDAAPLSDVLPIVERMGLRALVEHGFELTPADGRTVWVHELILRRPAGPVDIAAVKGPFEAAFVAVWRGLTENDGFNRLVVELGLDWREAALIRTLARWRQQTGLDPSQGVQEQALADNPDIARLILKLFHVKFDPLQALDLDERRVRADALFGRIEAELQAVESLDADRVLRRLARLVAALTRTNYYQRGPDGAPKPYISIKIASQDLVDLPAPKPHREIFVWSPQVEGVHLRFGPVARGGLRWSDRQGDFRTEVLGLAKAQQVKNAVIVPVGAKGGFYPKQLPRGGSPDAVRGEAIASYRTFLCGLLDLTDNLDEAGRPVPPPDVVRHDGDDPYLVVAADKGTATFSDIANGMAQAYGFWLGDAFASGGSAG